jgi:transcriptional regulator with XRE-family HTH domain
MSARKEEFGPLVRRERESRKIGLRDMARRIGVSPTYLSMVERGEFPPPAEDKVVAIADILGSNRDKLLALAGRISSDVHDLIVKTPKISALVRAIPNLSPSELERLSSLLKQSREDVAELKNGVAQLKISWEARRRLMKKPTPK